MNMFSKKLMLGALMAGFTVMPAMATETIKAVVIDGYPARALWVKEFSDFFIPEVDKILATSGNYSMDWQESYGGSIVKPKDSILTPICSIVSRTLSFAISSSINLAACSSVAPNFKISFSLSSNIIYIFVLTLNLVISMLA